MRTNTKMHGELLKRTPVEHPLVSDPAPIAVSTNASSQTNVEADHAPKTNRFSEFFQVRGEMRMT